MADDIERSRMEQRAISDAGKAGAKLINRGVTRGKDFFSFKVAFLEQQLAKAKQDRDAAPS